MFYIDQFVYSNKMRNSHPLERFIFALLSMMICLVTKDIPVSIFVMIVMLIFLVLKAKIPFFVVGKLLLFPMSFLILGVLAIVFTITKNEISFLFAVSIGSFSIGITKVGLLLALQTFFTALSSVCCLYFLVLTVPLIEIIYVLQLLKMPEVVIELMMLIYRFIFIFIETAFNIYTAQSSRWGHSSFKKSLNSFGLLFANLWGKAFLKSQALFTSLISRGYDNRLKVLNPSYSFSRKNIVIYLLLDSLFLAVVLI